MRVYSLIFLISSSFAFAEVNCDFGDFPDTGYDQTANHPIVPGLFLGSTAPDAEVAATPNTTATGDDASGSDEDVSDFPVVTTFDVPGNSSIVRNVITIPITNSSGATANGWAFIDFDRDGVLGEANETSGPFVVNSSPTPQTVNFQLTLNIPKSFYPQDAPLLMPIRFRLSTDSSLGPAGAALDGEVEDHFLDLGTLPSSTGGNNGTDYGDLPLAYDQSANHVATNNLFLGQAAGDGEAAAPNDF